MFKRFKKIEEEYGYLHCAVEDYVRDKEKDCPWHHGYVVNGIRVCKNIYGKKIINVSFYTRLPEGKHDTIFWDLKWKDVEPYLRDYLPKRKKAK